MLQEAHVPGRASRRRRPGLPGPAAFAAQSAASSPCACRRAGPHGSQPEMLVPVPLIQVAAHRLGHDLWSAL